MTVNLKFPILDDSMIPDPKNMIDVKYYIKFHLKTMNLKTQQ